MSKKNFDPNLFPIKGDISRRDAKLLYSHAKACSSDYVFEFGAGGSTIFLAGTGKKVVCYDDSQEWIDKTKNNLLLYDDYLDGVVDFRLVNYNSPEEYMKIASYAQLLDPAFIYIDGNFPYRGKVMDAVLLRAVPGTLVMIHDCRRVPDINQVLDVCKKYSNSIEFIKPNYMDSNMFLIKKGSSYMYHNWNVSEKDDNRVNWMDVAATGLERYEKEIQ